MNPRNASLTTITSVLLLLLALVAFSSSCSLRKGKPAAEQAVAKFHQQLDAEQYREIYSAAHQGFREGTPEEQCLRFLQAVHRKMGEVRESSQTGFFFNVNTEGTWIRLNYRTQFRNGTAAEQFIWHINGDQAQLFRYDINSDALVVMDSPEKESYDALPAKAEKRLDRIKH